MKYYGQDEPWSKVVNDKRFRRCEELSDTIVEVEKAKKSIKLDVAIHIGAFVLDRAKLILLRFYYDFLIKFLPFDSFCLVQADTDSMYLSLSQPSLFLCVKPEKRDQFVDEFHHWFANEYCPDHKSLYFTEKFAGRNWEPQDCCKTAAKYDSRTVGKFHMEWEGDEIVALCSKCYYCSGKKDKISSKGISKRNNYELNDFKTLLEQPGIKSGTNRRFRVRKNGMYTFTQNKKGLNFFYGKRLVSADNVTTTPTNL